MYDYVIAAFQAAALGAVFEFIVIIVDYVLTGFLSYMGRG